jgi:hypothetical protein
MVNLVLNWLITQHGKMIVFSIYVGPAIFFSTGRLENLKQHKTAMLAY